MEEKLKKYCTVISGYAFKSQDLSEGVDIPIIKIGNISNGENIIVDNSTQYVNKEFLSIDKKYHVLKGDILISLTGSHMNQPNSMVGRCCRNLDDAVYLLNQRAGKVIPKKTVNKDFLYYVFRLKSIQYAIANRAYGGANQVNVSPKDIMGIKFRIPNFTVQNRIADILTTYDNLIENNNKRIKLLEQMAENLYKEWFVRFRFPGYEDMEFAEGIPSNWNYVKLGDIVSFERGISYSSAEIDCDDGINLINLKNIQPYGGFRREGTKKYNGRYKESQIVKAGDLILGVTDMTQDRRTVGSVALIPSIEGVSVISADLVKIISEVPNPFIYCMCIYGFYSKYFSHFANGANVLHLKPNTLLNKKVLLPTKNLIEEFIKIIQPMIDIIDKINLQNDILIKQRDLLLPRLMSGKIEV